MTLRVGNLTSSKQENPTLSTSMNQTVQLVLISTKNGKHWALSLKEKLELQKLILLNLIIIDYRKILKSANILQSDFIKLDLKKLTNFLSMKESERNSLSLNGSIKDLMKKSKKLTFYLWTKKILKLFAKLQNKLVSFSSLMAVNHQKQCLRLKNLL